MTYSSVIKVEVNALNNALRAFADAGGVISLNYPSAANESVSIKVVNMAGQLVGSVNKNVAAGQNTIRLNELAKPASGVYVVVQGQT